MELQNCPFSNVNVVYYISHDAQCIMKEVISEVVAMQLTS